MAVWNKLKHELDRAGRAAQDALDEGRVRLDAFRARQLADKAAQALGYALYRARQAGTELDTDSYARLSSTLAAHEAEANLLEQKLEDIRGGRGDHKSDEGREAASQASASTEPPSTPPPAA
jgi:hypothetical protein